MKMSFKSRVRRPLRRSRRGPDLSRNDPPLSHRDRLRSPPPLRTLRHDLPIPDASIALILLIGDNRYRPLRDLTRNAAKAHSNAHLALPPRRRYRVCRLDTTRYTIAARFLSEQLPSSACFHSRFSTRRRKRRSCFNHNHVPNSITQSTLQLRPLSLDVRSTWYYRLSR